MNRAIFFDIDGTLTGTVSGEPFKKHPKDVLVLPGVKEGFDYYRNQSPKWVMIGISNQGSVFRRKSIEDAISETIYTLELLPELEAIYFCPDFEGLVCWRVTHNGASQVSNHERVTEYADHEKFKFRKPGAGMIMLASIDFGVDLKQAWMIGDRPQDDEEAAANAGIQFMDAETWQNRFKPGMYQVNAATKEQILFLESKRFSNESN